MIRQTAAGLGALQARRWSTVAVAIGLLLGTILFPLRAVAGNIFDDDWNPPAKAKPATPTPAAPETKPAPAPAPGKTAPLPNPPGAVPSSPPVAAPPAPLARRAIPPAGDQAKSRKLFKEIFATELADRSPAARRELAAKLLEQAGTVGDAPADQFVLLTGAIEAAKEASDLGLACKAADALGEAYDADALHLKSDAATKMTLRAASPNDTKANCRVGLELIGQLIAVDDYAATSHLLLALRAASQDAVFSSQLQSIAKEVESLRAIADRIAGYQEKLKTSSDDPTANLVVGQYFCYVKDDWPRGLPLLAREGKTLESAAAMLDLAGASDPAKQVDVGNAWWAVAEKQVAAEQLGPRQRAVTWYTTALGSGAISGLKRTLLEKRIADVQAMPVKTTAAAGLVPGLVAELFGDPDYTKLVKKRIDRQIYFEWQNEGPDSKVPGERFSIRWTGILQVPRTGKYTLFASVDDEVEIWVDGKSVLAQHHETRSAKASASFTVGSHLIQIDYRNIVAEGRLMLQWEQENGFPRQSLGRDALWHAREAAFDAEPALPGWRSDLICGQGGGKPFREIAPMGTVLVGFELTQHPRGDAIVLKSVRAIYRGASGDVMGAQFGEPEGDAVRLVAKPGYAVGSIRARSAAAIDGMSLHFMSLRGGVLDPADSYDSDYVGGTGGDPVEVGEGKPVIGIYGIAQRDCHGVGLITKE